MNQAPRPALAPVLEPPAADLAEVAERLRLIRMTSQQRRYPGREAPRLPSRVAVVAILGRIVGLLYPRHHGPETLMPDRTDRHVQDGLAAVRDDLVAQIGLEWLLLPGADARHVPVRARAAADAFLQDLPVIRDLHDTDIAAAYAGDPSAHSIDEIILCFPGIAALLRHRIAHRLFALGATMIARIIAEHSHGRSGIDIHPGARIGPACFIDHGTGVVIGETAVIGRNVRLYQNVTLGAKRFEDDGQGGLVKGRPRHPVIGDNVVIYAGASILGRVEIGAGAIIGGGVWLTAPVSEEVVVTQAQPRLMEGS